MQQAMKLREVADILQVSTETVRREIIAGRLDAFKVGDQYRVTTQALAEYMGVASVGFPS